LYHAVRDVRVQPIAKAYVHDRVAAQFWQRSEEPGGFELCREPEETGRQERSQSHREGVFDAALDRERAGDRRHFSVRFDAKLAPYFNGAPASIKRVR